LKTIQEASLIAKKNGKDRTKTKKVAKLWKDCFFISVGSIELETIFKFVCGEWGSGI
jgi:hypothetical protein